MTTATRQAVRLERDEGAAWITLDRPPLNILDQPTLVELADVLDDAAGWRDAHAIVIRGAGKAFCAGLDVADHTADRIERALPAFHRVVRAALDLDLPVVAAVHGPALGGGCEIAMACDVVLAGERATFGQPEVRLGVFPPVAAALLPRLVGRQRALDLVLTGRTLNAAEAHAAGLATHVLPADRFEEEVARYVGRLAALSAPVLRLTKRAVDDGADADPATAIDRAEALYLRDLMRLPDAREGIAAFLEKRPPRWER